MNRASLRRDGSLLTNMYDTFTRENSFLMKMNVWPYNLVPIIVIAYQENTAR